MAKCYFTGKTTITGNKRSHALNATRRTWKANLQTVRIKDDFILKRKKLAVLTILLPLL